MEILVRILIVDDDRVFVKKLESLVSHPQVVVDNAIKIPENAFYNFYVLGGSSNITEAVDKIRKHNEGSPIYLSGSVCDQDIPIRKMVRCNIVGCLESDEGIQGFAKKISSFLKQKARLYKAASKLDCLATGDLKSLARQLEKTESDRFVDYIQNHPLPMVLVSCESDVLHANAAMETMIGTKLSGAEASLYWFDPKELDRVVFDLKEKGQLIGREVTLKNIHGKQLRMKLYTSLHHDAEGNWLNTRCLFVPIDLPE